MKNNFNSDLGKSPIVYSSIISKELLLAYNKWSNSYTNKDWILFCNLCERENKNPLKVQKLIINN